jgi:hypothetical protein
MPLVGAPLALRTARTTPPLMKSTDCTAAPAAAACCCFRMETYDMSPGKKAQIAAPMKKLAMSGPATYVWNWKVQA